MRRTFPLLSAAYIGFVVAVGCSRPLNTTPFSTLSTSVGGATGARATGTTASAPAAAGREPTVTGAADASRPAGKVRVAFVSNNPFEFWTIARRGTEKAAAEFNAQVDFQMPARGTAAEQRQIVEDLLTKGVQGIAISPNDAANQAGFLDEVVTKNKVPVITQDSDLPPGSQRLCYVGTNNFAAGQAAGELVKKAIPQGGKVVIFVGKLDVQNAVERRNGIVAVLGGVTTFKEADALVQKGYPLQLGTYTLLDTMTDDGKAEKCKANAEDLLTKTPDVKCLVGLWEYNPPQMLLAVKEQKRAGQVAIVGFDENDATLQGIRDGHVTGTVVQQPFEFGYQSVRILAAVARGDKSVLPQGGIQYVPHQVITKENVDAFWKRLNELKGKG